MTHTIKTGLPALALLLAGAAMAQPVAPAKRVAADYERAASMLADRTTPLIDHSISGASWLDDDSLVYTETAQGKPQALRFYPGQRRSKAAYDADALSAAIKQAAGGHAPAMPAGRTPPMDITRHADGSLILAGKAGEFRCTRHKCSALPKVDTGPEPGTASPDGHREAFVRAWNLWLRDTATGKETQLTFDGAKDYGYATDNAGWKHTNRAVVLWSPDGDKIATYQQDQTKTRTMTLVGTNVGAPKVEQWKYPFAGDRNVTLIERVIIDLTGDKPRTIRLKMPPDQHRSTLCDDVRCRSGWEDVQWAKDGRTLAFVSTDRGHKWAQLRVADTTTGAVRDVYRETVKTQYESGQGGVNWRYLPASNEFLWYSEKSNWGHLYLHDLTTGKLKRQITSGDWLVTRITHLDPATRSIWFLGVGREAGENPYYAHYYRVGMDDGDVRLLTPENADHRITPSKDGKYFLDVHSTIDSAPVAVVRDGNGNKIADIAHTDLTRLQASGWVPPSAFSVKARDGKTDLYGQMFKPSNFDPNKKYPIVTYIYPGPQVGSIRSWSFMPAAGDNQALAELGFIVIALDGMGTPLRSKSFHDVSYGNMADNTLPDQVAALKQLGERHAWIDTSRAGIWGHSGGGNATAAAMFRYPDIYKVGIAESGNHDNLSYEDDWAERYQGLVEDKPDGTTSYTGQDNAPLAKNLKGKLFLLHGLMDDNVPPQSTLLVVDALIKANKDFDLLLLPHARHGYGKDSYYVMRRRWDYFVSNLLGAEPPREFELKRKT